MSEIALVFLIYIPKTNNQWKVFEDNTSYITVSKALNMTPRTKYITFKYYYFIIYTQREITDIQYVNTKEKTADIFTKPVNEIIFLYLRKNIVVSDKQGFRGSLINEECDISMTQEFLYSWFIGVMDSIFFFYES